MNRIILIGNGFDLAHDLKTSYKSFIEWVWEEKVVKAIIEATDTIQDVNGTFKCHIDNGFVKLDYDFKYMGEESSLKDCKNIEELYNKLNGKNFFGKKLQDTFLYELLLKNSNGKWVDIEEFYYIKLKEAARIDDEDERHEGITKLNDDLEVIKRLLNEYLSIEEKKVLETDYNKNILEAIYGAFKLNDFNARELPIALIEKAKQELRGDNDYSVKSIISALSKHISYIHDIKDVYAVGPTSWKGFVEGETEDQLLFNDIIGSKTLEDIFKCVFLPSHLLFLNFNYTNTVTKYNTLPDIKNLGFNFEFDINHIHGTLNNDSNTENMIFGYGDEISDEYRELENLNENVVLENVKSIRYLDTNNYSDLIRFIELDEYQIYIMGHSCGISDRTLLNTLFEHKNCLSIKPFHYSWIDANGQPKDNYREIVQNISRNFNNKAVMRSKVVNKQYCEPMPQKNK